MGTSSCAGSVPVPRASSCALRRFRSSFYDIDVADDLTRLAEDLRVAPEKARPHSALAQRVGASSAAFL